MHRVATSPAAPTRRTSFRFTLGVASLAMMAGLMAACGNGGEQEPTSSGDAAANPGAESDSHESTSKTSSEATASTRASATATRPRVVYTPSKTTSALPTTESAVEAHHEPNKEKTDAEADIKLNDSVIDAYETFKDLAPRSLFAQFKDCSPAGIKDSFNCTGPAAGQIQLIKSESKAAQTTQVLTELRSSRVLSDDGNVVIGWSTLGSTAVLTAVDNDRGLVLQQMISTDQEDPETKLQQLGLLPS